MKNSIVRLFGLVSMAILLTACQKNNSKVNQVIQNQIQEAENANRSDEIQEAEKVPPATVDEPEVTGDAETDSSKPVSVKADVDLTQLSSTMVYSEVFNMMYDPGNYIGKTIRINGMFVVYTNQDYSQFYPAVIIADATACCSQGLEFVLEGNPPYPEGYPETETVITVIGTFETYLEDGKTYCRLQNARIE